MLQRLLTSSYSNSAITITLADDESVTLPPSKIGRGWLMVGDDEEYSDFRFSQNATVTLFSSSANVINSDTDTNFCIFGSANSVVLKNRLGATKVIKYFYWV